MTGKSLGAEPAFPFQEWGQTGTPASQAQPGVNKRELFAAMAMQGAIAGSQGLAISHAQFAQAALRQAEALLNELAKGQP